MGLRLVGYVRVSEVEESVENQEYVIYRWASSQGHTIVKVLADVGVSGALPPKERPAFKQVLEALASPEVDGVVVSALDRIARSLFELVNVIKEIEESKKKVVLSVREEWLQSLDPRIRGFIIATLGWAGEMEREFIRERTKLALARLKAQGKPIGRPRKITEHTIKEALKYAAKGLSLKAVARMLGVSYYALNRAILRNPTWRAEYYSIKARLRKI